MRYLEKLRRAQESNRSWLCLGLDPQPELLPVDALKWDEPLLPFNRAIIDATADLVCAYKPNQMCIRDRDNVAFGKVLAIATLDELANLSSYVSRVSYAVAVNCGQEPEVMEPAAAIMAATMVIGGGLQFAEAVVAITV